MGDDASSRSLDVQAGQLREFLADLAARVAAIEAARDRAERRDRIGEILATAGQPPGPRHAAPKRDRHGLRVIPGGLAALAPAAFLFHDGLAAAALTAWQWMWRAQRAHGRWALAALLLATVGVSVPVAASDGRAPAHHALSCRAPRPYHPDRDGDGDSDDRIVVAPLPPACPAAGEGAVKLRG